MVNNYLFWAILVSALVTWLPRIFPFILVKYRDLPKLVVQLLKYLPITIIFALTLSSLVTGKVANLPRPNLLEILATLPTIWIAFRYKNLLVTVIFGVACMALLRLVF